MRRCVVQLVALVSILGPASLLSAAESLPVEGTLLMGGRPYKLTHAIAYVTKPGDEELITLLASTRALPVARLKAEFDKQQRDDAFSLSQPYVKVVFSKSGEVQGCSAWADNSAFSTNSGKDMTGELKIEANRVQGKVVSPPQNEGDSRRGFDFRFDVALGFDKAASPKSAPTGPVKPMVEGKFTGNGKPAKLAYVSAHPREPFGDKPAIMLVFTEKDHSKEPRPDIKAGFGKFGSALIISVNDEGGIFGCEVAHAAHARQGFSSIGSIHMNAFEISDRHIAGQITTDGEQDAFGQKWDVDLKFAAPLAGLPAKPVAPAKPTTPAAPSKPKKMPAKPKEPAASEPQPKDEVATLNVHDLPFPKDATDLEYKQIVEQLGFKSPAKVPALAADLTKKLAAQGWTNDAVDLVNPATAILNRTRGDATLTIMIKPAGGGSQVTIFATGLNWEEKEK